MRKNAQHILEILKKSHDLTLTEIQRSAEIEHKPVALYHLNKLVNEGKIIRKENLYNFFSDEKKEFVDLPYYGEAQAGRNGRFKEGDDPEYFMPIPTNKLVEKPENLFLMKVVGNSMEPTIKEESIVMFKWLSAGEDIRDDEIILCSVNNGELKIKRFKNMKTYGLLLSDNKDEYEPIPINDHNFHSIGKMVNILR